MLMCNRGREFSSRCCGVPTGKGGAGFDAREAAPRGERSRSCHRPDSARADLFTYVIARELFIVEVVTDDCARKSVAPPPGPSGSDRGHDSLQGGCHQSTAAEHPPVVARGG